jgi:hypothetical protein
MRMLVLLIDQSVLSSGGTGGQLGLVILSDLLVGFLGCLGSGALDRLGNVVGGALCLVSKRYKMQQIKPTNLDGVHGE